MEVTEWPAVRDVCTRSYVGCSVHPRSYVESARGFHMLDSAAYAVLLLPTMWVLLFWGMPALGDLFRKRRLSNGDVEDCHGSLV